MPHYASDPSSLFPLQGGCPCGHTRYALTLPPLIVHCCYCLACQRAQGSSFALNAVVESSAITILPSLLGTEENKDPSGAKLGLLPYLAQRLGADNNNNTSVVNNPKRLLAEPLDKSSLLVTAEPSASGLGHATVRCPECRTGLWGYYASGDHWSYLRVGTLDKAGMVEPDVHIFTRSKPSFISIADDKPQFEGYYQDRTPFYRDDDGSKERVAAMQPTDQKWKTELKAALRDAH